MKDEVRPPANYNLITDPKEIIKEEDLFLSDDEWAKVTRIGKPAGEFVLYARPKPDIPVPPEGYELVTTGAIQEGDLIYGSIKKVWKLSIFGVGMEVESFTHVARRINTVGEYNFAEQEPISCTVDKDVPVTQVDEMF